MPPTRKGRKKKKRKVRVKVCRFCEDRVMHIDYKDTSLLTRYMTERGRIIPSRITGTCPNHQKMLTRAVKRARVLSMVL